MPGWRRSLLNGCAGWRSRSFSQQRTILQKPLPPRMVIAETDLSETFLKGSGPGGQKINKTSSAVQLKHLPSGLVVKSQATRSRDQNRKIARRLLADRLDEIEKGDESRTAIRTDKARKKKASATKKSRRKYKKLDEETASIDDGDEHSVTGAADQPTSGQPFSITGDREMTDPNRHGTTTAKDSNVKT